MLTMIEGIEIDGFNLDNWTVLAEIFINIFLYFTALQDNLSQQRYMMGAINESQ